MKDKIYFFKIWEVLYPFALYYAVNLIAMYVALMLMGFNPANYMVAEIFGAGVTIPIVLKRFYFPDRMYLETDSIGYKKSLINGIVIAIIAWLIGTGLNNIISMSPLVAISEGYRKANENFYGSTLIYELIGSGLMVPILEELVFRGIIFYRIKRSTGKKWLAVFVSALMFALMHLNLVQFTFAFILGIALAIFMDKSEHVYGPIVAHMVINIFGVVRTEFGLMGNMVDKSVFAWAGSIVLFVIGVIMLVIYEVKAE